MCELGGIGLGSIRRVALILAAIAVIPACGQTTSTPLAPAPGNPTSLSALGVSSIEIDLSWTNDVLTQTSVTIERSPDDIVFTTLVTVDGTSNSYHDQTAFPSSTYFYRVLALNDTTPSAAYSNVASATTKTPAWSPVSPGLPAPGGTVNMAWTSLSGLGQMLIYSGDDVSFPAANRQTWNLKYSGAGAPSWTQQGTGTDAGVRSGATIAYVPITKVYGAGTPAIVVFGGLDASDPSNPPTVRQDTWTLNPSGPTNWTSLATAGGPPASRFGHAMVQSGSKVYVIGGQTDAFAPTMVNDVWTLDFSSPTPVWSELFSSAPMAPRAFHSAILDTGNNQIVIFGGSDGTNLRNDTWAIDLNGTPFWKPISSGALPPSGRISASAVYSASAKLMIIFGGNAFGGSVNDVWALSLSGSTSWTPLLVTGSLPGIRGGQAAAFDDGAHRMFLFGGQDALGGTLYSDVWQLQF